MIKPSPFTDILKGRSHCTKINKRFSIFSNSDDINDENETVTFKLSASNSTEEEAISNILLDMTCKKLAVPDARNTAFNKAHLKAKQHIMLHEKICVRYYRFNETLMVIAADLAMAKLP